MKFGRKEKAAVKTLDEGKAKRGSDNKAKPSGTFLHSWAWQPALFSLVGIIALGLIIEVLFLGPSEQAVQTRQHQLAVSVLQKTVNAHVQERAEALAFASQNGVSNLPFADVQAFYRIAPSEIGILRNQYPGLSFASVDIVRSALEKQTRLVEGFFHEDEWFLQIAQSRQDGGIDLAIFKAAALRSALSLPKGFVPGESALIAGQGSGRKVAKTGSGIAAHTVYLPTAVPQWRVGFAPAANGGFSLDRVLPLSAIALVGIILAVGLNLLVRMRMAVLKQALLQATQTMRAAIAGESKKAVNLPYAELNSMVTAITQVARQQTKAHAKAVKENAKPATEVATADSDAPLFEDDLLDLDVLSEAEMTNDPLQQDINEDLSTGAIVEEVAQLDVNVPQSIFRAYDIRGVVDETLNEQIVELIGKALASEALAQGQQTLCVGYDGRLSSVPYCEAMTRGIVSTGANAIIVGEVPTPVLYFATHQHQTGTGVMITGSHNPANYNGFKMMIAGNTLSGDDIQKLYQRIVTQDFASGQGARSEQPVDRDYLDTILNDIAVAAPLKVVVDAGNGVAGGLAPALIEELGCEVIPLFCEVDGTFPNHHPDPGKPENLQDLIAAVQQHNADIGLAFDGDGDRVGVVTNAGKIIWPDRLLMLFAKDVVARNPGADIIYDVKCSRRLSSLITGYGGRPVMWKTGHSLIKAKMKETGALLAGEMSGHIFFKERWFGFDDGLYSAARLLEILGVDDRPAEDIFADFPEDVSTPEINITVTDESKFNIVDKLCAMKDQFAEGSVSTIDGLRVDYPNGWGLCRASNTTPVLVLRFEADDEAALQQIKDTFKQVLQQVDSSLNLDF